MINAAYKGKNVSPTQWFLSLILSAIVLSALIAVTVLFYKARHTNFEYKEEESIQPNEADDEEKQQSSVEPEVKALEGDENQEEPVIKLNEVVEENAQVSNEGGLTNRNLITL